MTDSNPQTGMQQAGDGVIATRVSDCPSGHVLFSVNGEPPEHLLLPAQSSFGNLRFLCNGSLEEL